MGRRFESCTGHHSHQIHEENKAGVAELADAPDLGSGAFGHGGSSPFTRTCYIKHNAGLAQLVEHLICNQRVEGSSPLAGIQKRGSSSVVEHHLAKVGVAGSNPVFRFHKDYARPYERNNSNMPGWRNWQTHRT